VIGNHGPLTDKRIQGDHGITTLMCIEMLINNDIVYCRDDMHLWLAPFTSRQNHYIYITFNEPIKIAMLRIWVSACLFLLNNHLNYHDCYIH